MKPLDIKARTALTISAALIIMGAGVAFVTNFAASGPVAQSPRQEAVRRPTKVVTVYVADLAPKSVNRPVSPSGTRRATSHTESENNAPAPARTQAPQAAPGGEDGAPSGQTAPLTLYEGSDD